MDANICRLMEAAGEGGEVHGSRIGGAQLFASVETCAAHSTLQTTWDYGMQNRVLTSKTFEKNFHPEVPLHPQAGTMFAVEFVDGKNHATTHHFDTGKPNDGFTWQHHKWKTTTKPWPRDSDKRQNPGPRLTIRTEHLICDSPFVEEANRVVSLTRVRVCEVSDTKGTRQLITYQGDYDISYFKKGLVQAQETKIKEGSTSLPVEHIAPLIAPSAQVSYDWGAGGDCGWLMREGDCDGKLTIEQLRNARKLLRRKPQVGEVEKMMVCAAPSVCCPTLPHMHGMALPLVHYSSPLPSHFP